MSFIVHVFLDVSYKFRLSLIDLFAFRPYIEVMIMSRVWHVPTI